MIAATSIVAVLFILLAISRKSAGAALGILIMSMMIWPEYIRVPMGLTQMSVPRMVALVLLIRFFMRGMHRKIKFGTVDRLVIFIWVWTVMANILAGAEFSQISQMIGRGQDTVLVYFVARIAFNSPDDVKGLSAAIGVTAFVMCLAGVYEAVTWTSPYHYFYSYLGKVARVEHADQQIRLGLLRAQTSTMVSIYFGMAMVLLTGMLWSIRGYLEKPGFLKLILMMSVIATLSSMSSGPWIGIFMVFGATFYYLKPNLIKPSVYMIFFCALLLELLSNRHFYNLIDYFALDKQTAWYRTRLLEVAVTQWRDFWLVGVGSKFPYHWAAMIDGREFLDVVNNFLIVALYGGVPALIMYVATHWIAIKQTSIAWKKNRQDTPRRKLLFGLAAALLAIDFASMSVGLFGPALLLSYVLLGMMISVTSSWSPGEPAKTVGSNRMVYGKGY